MKKFDLVEVGGSACKEEKEIAAFRCPNCAMADTCSDCSMFGSDGWCKKHGGYTDADKWACPWYYSH